VTVTVIERQSTGRRWTPWILPLPVAQQLV